MTEAKSIDDHGRLTAARKRLAELQKSSEQHAGDVRQLQTELNAGVAAVTEESERALIDAREPDGRIVGAVAPLRKKLEAGQTKLDTIRGAVARQRSTVSEIESQIDVGRRQVAILTARPIYARFLEHIEEASELARQLFELQKSSGTHEWLLPEFSGNRTRLDGRDHLASADGVVLTALLSRLAVYAQFDPALRKKLGIVEAETTPVPPTPPIPARPELYMRGGTIYRGARPS